MKLMERALSLSVCTNLSTYVSFDVALAVAAELFLELERLDMLGDVSAEKAHCDHVCFCD